jgi:hypothetical protein
MVIKADISALSLTKWYEYALRFFFGGMMTVIAGLIAKHYGPVLGGLFLAFPAIAPAAATLMDQHAKEQKQRAGFEGHTRGRKVAALDMYGTLWGTVGLLAFALVVWRLGPSHGTWMVLAAATVAWFVGALSVWELRRLMKQWRAARHKPALLPVSVPNQHRR